MRILAHRGGHRPGVVENTVAAVTAAFAEGADGVEVDLRLSRDGVLVVSHDADLVRLCGSSLDIATSSWESLERTALRSGVRLARVEWVLAAAAGRRIVLELKAGTSDSAAVLVERLSDLSAAGLSTDVTVSSFDRELVRRFRARAESRLGVRTALLGAPGSPASSTLRAAVVDGHHEVHPHVSDLLDDPAAVAAAAALGRAIVPWTVNPTRTVRRCADLGVSAVITDRPRAAADAVSRATAR